MPKQTLAFDISGPFGHYKKIFATTTALSYPIPPKTTIYGMVAAILGLDKNDNDYLKSFQEGQCKIGIQLLAPVKMQRININLRPGFGSMTVAGKSNPDNRKPTLMEYIRKPHYRVYFQHEDENLFNRLAQMVQKSQSTYTPTLGLANLIAKVDFAGLCTYESLPADAFYPFSSVIPKSHLVKLDSDRIFIDANQLVEVGQYAVEMLPNRDVTKRDDVIFDRNGQPISAKVVGPGRLTFSNSNEKVNVLLF